VGNDQDEDECEGCERLKQLVFQAKEAIDDLKGEIEEWRDICAEKETELR
jgi:thioredoxin-related protein